MNEKQQVSRFRKLKVLPLQYIEVRGGVLLKRGRHEIKVGGQRATGVAQAVLGLAAGGSHTAEQIVEHFAEPDREDIRRLVEHLETRRFLVPCDEDDSQPSEPETSLDVFYWHFGLRTASVNALIDAGRIAVIGVNCVSKQVVSSLTDAGVTNIDVVHCPLLCNLRLFASDGSLPATSWPENLPRPLEYGPWSKRLDTDTLSCIVATSDFGGLGLMRPWNEFCVGRRKHFLPVVLQDLIGYIGPLVVPGDTACFECLRGRQNANMTEPEIMRAPEARAFVEQATVGFHPAMASALGSLAALELSRFYGQFAPPRVVGTLLEVNLVAPSLDARKVLKLPRCPVCSPLNAHSPSSPERNAFLPGNEWPQ